MSVMSDTTGKYPPKDKLELPEDPCMVFREKHVFYTKIGDQTWIHKTSRQQQDGNFDFSLNHQLDGYFEWRLLHEFRVEEFKF